MSHLRIPTSSLIIALAIALAACSGGDSGTEEGSEELTAMASSTSAEQSSRSTDSPATDVAAAFMAARDSHDADAMLALLSPDAAIIDFGFWSRTPEEYRGLTEWWKVVDYRWTVEVCEEFNSGPPAIVQCTNLIENAWSRAQGASRFAAN